VPDSGGTEFFRETCAIRSLLLA